MTFGDNFCKTIALMGFLLITDTVQQLNDPQFMKQDDAIAGECAAQFNFTTQYVDDIWKLKEFPKDNNMKCYFSCVALKSGTMNEAGDVQEDVLEKVATEFFNLTIAEKIGDMCDIAKNGDLCQTAYDMMQCMLNMLNGQQG